MTFLWEKGSPVRRHSSRRPLFEGQGIAPVSGDYPERFSVTDGDRLCLQPTLGVLLLVLVTGCTYKAPVADTSALTSHPGVSAPVIEATRARLMASNATVQSFNCQAYAQTLLPWKGPNYTDPLFRAANEATLPDAPEFAARRQTGCAILERAADSAATAQ
jgi:hypothetical protein